MKSRAISALVFGLCFSIIFTGISFFAPPITRYTCGGSNQYEVGGVMMPGQDRCSGGGSTMRLGFPFGSRVHESQGTISPNSTGYVADKPGYQVSIAGALGNFVVYLLIGFIFFFIFSRSRNAGKPKKSNS